VFEEPVGLLVIDLLVFF